MKNLPIKLLLTVLTTLGAANSLYSMDEAPGFTAPVRDVYAAVAQYINSTTPQENADRLTLLKSKIAKVSATEAKLTDNFTGNATILEVIRNTKRDNPHLSPQIKQGLTEAINLLEAKSLGK